MTVGILIFQSLPPKYDNTVLVGDIVTETYTSDAIERLENKIEKESVSFKEFKRDFRVECLRKIHNAYYTVLLQDDGIRVFVFIDENFDNIISIYKSSGFKTKLEFDEFLEGKNNLTDVDMSVFDENTFDFPYSGNIMTAHIVKEGAYIVFYEYQTFGEPPVVVDVKYYSNDNEEYRTLFGASPLFIPYILEIDKF